MPVFRGRAAGIAATVCHASRIAPRTGGLLAFSPSQLPEMTPLTMGERNASLPFLYDEAGAKFREQDLAFVQEPPGGSPQV